MVAEQIFRPTEKSTVVPDEPTAEELVADELVRKYGDWTPDYLVPQVFLEYEGARFLHVLTGDPRGVTLTKMAVETLLSSELLPESK